MKDSHKLLDSLLSDDVSLFKETLDDALTERIFGKFESKKEDIMKSLEEEDSASVNDPDIALDPRLDKEFFLKSLDVKGHKVTLKSIGVGPTKPVVAYVNGKRWEVFPGPKRATKEVKQYIKTAKPEELKPEPKPEPEAKPEVKSEVPEEKPEETKESLNPTLTVIHDILEKGGKRKFKIADGSVQIMTEELAYKIAKVHDSLSGDNQVRFGNMLCINNKDYNKIIDFVKDK